MGEHAEDMISQIMFGRPLRNTHDTVHQLQEKTKDGINEELSANRRIKRLMEKRRASR